MEIDWPIRAVAQRQGECWSAALLHTLVKDGLAKGGRDGWEKKSGEQRERLRERGPVAKLGE